MAYTDVYIRVLDVNDNVPHTYKPLYKPTIPENSHAGSTVCELNSYDADESSRFSYSITGGDPQGFFAIEEDTGKLSLLSRQERNFSV